MSWKKGIKGLAINWNKKLPVQMLRESIHKLLIYLPLQKIVGLAKCERVTKSCYAKIYSLILYKSFSSFQNNY